MPAATRGREARLGAFVLFGLLSFIVVLYALTDPATFRGRHILYSVMNDAGGVRRGDQIQMRGVNMQQVEQWISTRMGILENAPTRSHDQIFADVRSEFVQMSQDMQVQVASVKDKSDENTVIFNNLHDVRTAESDVSKQAV